MPQQRNLEKKHKNLQDGAARGGAKTKSTATNSSNVIGVNSAAVPYRVSRVAQPTQHRQFQVISENRKADDDDDDDLDDTWI